jgi:cobaltochelatase CobT
MSEQPPADDFCPAEPAPSEIPQETLDPQAAGEENPETGQPLPEDAVDLDEGNETTAPHEDGEQSSDTGDDDTYRAYSTQWDEERPARHFCTPEDLTTLQGLDPADQARIRRLALQLQRQLLSARQRHWQFDQDSGRLDSRRLARLLMPGAPPRIFREEQVSPVPEACVTLLVDQSGSMRGRPQQIAVQAIDLAVQTLEACRISCEVLGYTTVDGEDNPVVRSWRAHGQPKRPGRLNALRQLIYKSASDPWRRARPSLGLMLRADFGRENLDGEALDWAARRLAARPEPRKILLVLSDASPYDAATVAVHGRGYLETHLRQVIADIDASAIQLVAIGTSHRVGYYYRKAVVLHRHDTVADTLFAQLGELLSPSDPSRRP